jgi:hypothetical protein
MAFPKLEAHLKGIADRMKSGEVAVGFMEGSTYPDGTPVAAVAFWNEYGDPANNRPPRPFFRQMIAKEAPTWAAKMAALARKHSDESVLGNMGANIGGELDQSIKDFTEPPLKQSTIKAKGFEKPLIDTNVMVQNIVYQVNDGEKVKVT